MKKIIGILVLVLFLLACESVDEDTKVLETEEQTLEAEQRTEQAENEIEILNQQVAAMSDQLARIEAKLIEPKNTMPTAAVVLEEIPQNVTQLGNLSPSLLASGDVPPAPVAQEPEEEVLTEEIKAILSRADDIVTSYSYLYALPPSDISGGMVYIKESKMRIKLKETSVYGYQDYIDTIYVDFMAKTASGYCEDSRIQACANKSKKTVLDFNQYNIKTPYQWLKEIPVARKIASVIVWDRNADVLEHIEGDIRYTYWIDSFSGIPVRIIINTPDKEPVINEFRHLSVNYLDDEDVSRD